MSDYKETSETEVLEEQKSWEEAAECEPAIVPAVDIYETGEEFVLTANLPGVSKENVHLKMEENNLSIFGGVNYIEGLERKYVLNESLFANYYRKFKLSDGIDTSKITAKYENGQLVVSLPKHDKVKPRTISVS
ncbi:MAG: Hsp20/alpha crystallin family protein [Ignavibacteriaceae bacterium]|nr:Hsp20/alpha crystallin family protein [Ignavibacteriaceae bacterium]